MKEFLEFKNESIVESSPEAANIVVYTLPSELEKKELFKNLNIDAHGLESALDPDEISRVECGSEYLYIIWKRPNAASFKEQLKFEVSSFGIFHKQGKLTFILGEATTPFATKKMLGVTSLNGVILKVLLQTVHHFLGHLKVMRQLNTELQNKLNASMENRYLLQMFNLSESLIYYLNALEANASALAKLRANTDKIGFSKEEQDVLDDIMIEHHQCSKQAEIYASVISGLMDARGNIINNNMNILLRNLTLINVVFLPLNLIASVGGMSEYTMMTEGVLDWRLAYMIFLIAMITLGIVTWILLVKQINRQKVNHS
jgi:magnesium transporter